MPQTAREYFFAAIMEEDDKPYYREEDLVQSHRASNAGEEFIESIRQKFKNLQYSNDIDLDTIVKKIKSTNGWIPELFFDNLFVGKTRTNEVLAAAPKKSKKLAGKLIIYDVGLSLACLFTAECFDVYLKQYRDAPEDAQSFFFKDILDKFRNWQQQDLLIDLGSVLDFYVKYEIGASRFAFSISSLADEFIIKHEMAHHLMGDTGFIEEQLDILKQLAEMGGVFVTKKQEKEYIADKLAITLFSGGPEKFYMSSGYSELLGASFGSLLTCTTLALLGIESPYDSNEKYPSANARFDNASALITLAATFTSIYGGDPETLSRIKYLHQDLRDFHDLLNRYRLEAEGSPGT